MLIFGLQFSNTQHTTFLHVYTSYTHVYTCKIHNFHTTLCPLCISLTFFIRPKFIKNQVFILSPGIGLFTVFKLIYRLVANDQFENSHCTLKNEKSATKMCENMCKTPKKAKFTVFYPKIHNSYTHI